MKTLLELRIISALTEAELVAVRRITSDMSSAQEKAEIARIAHDLYTIIAGLEPKHEEDVV